jgi:hypothetical protein
MDWLWGIWIGGVIVSFALLERYAFAYPSRLNTLSRVVWSIGQKFPLSIMIFGFVVGVLSAHFFWNWCPALMPPGVGG